MALLKYVVLLHTDVPHAARFYSQGLGMAVTVCTHRWAQLQSGPFKISLLQAPSDSAVVKGHSPFLSFNVDDMDQTVRKLLSLGAELDGPIKYLSHGKVASVRGLDGHMLGLNWVADASDPEHIDRNLRTAPIPKQCSEPCHKAASQDLSISWRMLLRSAHKVHGVHGASFL